MIQFFEKRDFLLVSLVFLLIVFSSPLLVYPAPASHLRVDAPSAVLMDFLSGQVL
jgi:D-alanyl-D-alanine carboxypeptidase